MMITERQEKLLGFLVKEYITTSEPVGSLSLKKIADLEVCGATIRNDLQELAKEGYIKQPHTSSGRVPTKKAYRYFAQKIEKERENQFEDFIVRQIRAAHQQIEQEMRMAEKLIRTLEQDNLFEILNILDIWRRKTKN